MFPVGAGNGGVPSSIALTSAKIFIGYKTATTAQRSIEVFSRSSYASVGGVPVTGTGSLAIPVHDIEYQTTLGKFMAINNAEVRQFADNLTRLSKKSVVAAVKLAVDGAGFVYVASNGTGSDAKLRKAKQDASGWVSAFSSPSARFVAVAVNSGNTRVLGAETTNGTFKWLDATSAAVFGTVSTGGTPRAVYVGPGNLGYLATSTGVRKHPFGSSVAQRIAQVGTSAGSLSLSLHPNPVRGVAELRFTLPRSGEVSLRAFDLMGRDVQGIVQKPFPAGPHQLHWDTRSLRPGVYFLRLQLGREQLNRRVVIIR